MNKVNWIKCSDRMPELGVSVLTWSSDGLRTGSYKGESLVRFGFTGWFTDCRDSCECCDSYNDNITHWAEMIEGPDE